MVTIADGDAAIFRDALVYIVDAYVDMDEWEWNVNSTNDTRVLTLRRLAEILKGE